jgi:hypothetical protein
MRRCTHCGKHSEPSNRLGLFTHAAGESLVHLDCWKDWHREVSAQLFRAGCAVCGEPGSEADSLGLYLAADGTDAVLHAGCWAAWRRWNYIRRGQKHLSTQDGDREGMVIQIDQYRHPRRSAW